jgi:hypothetical protein
MLALARSYNHLFRVQKGNVVLANTLTDILPVLQSESVPCLFFVTTASCCDHSGTLWHDELYLLMRLRPLTAPDLQLPSDEDSYSAPAKSFAAQWWDTVKRASRLEAGARAQWMDRVRIHCNPTHDFRTEHRWQLLKGGGAKAAPKWMVSLDGVYERGLLQLIASVLILKLVGVEGFRTYTYLCPDNIAVRKLAL